MEGLGPSTWASDPVLAPARHLLERLLDTPDWGEIAFVVALLFDPAVAGLFLSRFLRRHATVEVVSMVHDADEAAHVHSVPADHVTTVATTPWRNRVRSALGLMGSTPLTHSEGGSGSRPTSWSMSAP